ncbi:hypothetical protein C3L33_10178, partial [Rhododendron williamsianum]
GARQVPYTINTNNGRFLSSSDSDVGICKSMVETQGYSCEEHTGTLMALAAFSQQQSLNMIRSASLLSPIAYLDQITTLLGKAAAYSMIGDVMYWLGVHEFVPGGMALNLYFVICGSCAVIRQGTIAMYDYRSEDDNNKHYGQPTPPVYNMSSIPNDLPLFLAHGGQDYLSDPADVQTLMGALSDHDANKLVVLYPKEYAHLDFTLAGNANQVVYDPIMSFFSLNSEH